MKSNNCLQEYLVQTQEAYPDNIAIKYGEKEVTYQELFRNSLNIAAMLKRMGLTKNNPVVFYCRKSDIAVEALYGIMLSQNAYVPIDKTSTPVYRCMVIVKESRAEYFLAEGEDLNKLVADCDFAPEIFKSMHVLVLDNDYQGDKTLFAEYQEMAWEIDTETLVELGTEEDSTAYILYTSGSTGIPKGVVLSHKNARAFTDWCLECFKPRPGERFLSIAPFHFDLAVFDLYVSIASGGCLVILPEKVEQNILSKIQYISHENINYMYSVPSLWIAILRYGKLENGSFPALKKVLFAGEIFQPDDLAEAMALVPNAEFYNLYGLIETNVVTYYKVKQQELQEQTSVPIGYASSGAELRVIQDGKKVIAEGMEGELYVSGPTIMKEYHGRKDLTEKVISIMDGKRYFRTGDIVRIGKNGELIFLSRNDFMVKRNGFRIELPEIEAALSHMKEVQEAVVVAIQSERQLYICAAVLAKEGMKPRVIELKHYLGSRLPSYMMPDYFSVMETFKRNASGKVDRSYMKEHFKTMI